MKKVIIFFLAIWLPLMTCAVNVEEHIAFTAHNETPDKSYGGKHRMPLMPISAYQKGHLLSFKNCANCYVFIYDEERVLGSAYIDENGKVEIPSDIEGTVQLVIIKGSTTYQADVEF